MIPLYDESTVVNVALGKAATQSSRSIWCRGPESLVNSDFTQPFGTHTNSEDAPWWQLDLGRRVPLQAIVVHNRADHLQEWARSLRVEISDDADAWTLVHGGLSVFGSRSNGIPLVIPQSGHTFARHVRVSLAEPGHLVLSQVEVLVGTAAMEMLRLRDEHALDIELVHERAGVGFASAYEVVAATGVTTGPLIGLALAENTAFGNCLIQCAVAFMLAKRLGLSFIKISRKDRSKVIRLPGPLTIDGVTFIPADDPLPAHGLFLSGYFFDITRFGRVMDHQVYLPLHEAMRNVVRRVFNLLPARIDEKPDDELLIHLRSGDVFSTWVDANYIQPPLSFYILVVQRLMASGRIRRVKLVYENKLNPVIEALEAHLAAHQVPFTAQSGSLVDDVTALVNGKYFAFGFGTFGPAICHLSDPIEKVVFFSPGHNLGFGAIPTVKDAVEITDSAGGYVKLGQWTNSEEQRAMMLNYPIENLGVVGEL